MKTLLASLLTLTPLVAGHGWLGWVAIDGKRYDGNTPNNPKFDSPIRLVDSNGPVQLETNEQFLPCGPGAANAKLVVDANPGSKFTVFWTGGDSLWPHEVGPLMTYMASCGSASCDQFDETGAKWFKINEVGKKDDGTWWQNDFKLNKSVDLTLPTDVTPGGYLVRHEIIALHNGQYENGAEFYPSCTQINVGGSGSGTPDPTISFPGAYSPKDPGILVNVYDEGSSYVFPGGPLSNLAVDGSSGSNSNSPAGNSSNTPSGGGGSSSPNGGGAQTVFNTKCSLKKSSDASVPIARRFFRHFARLYTSH